jgi:hypothetical protein
MSETQDILSWEQKERAVRDAAVRLYGPPGSLADDELEGEITRYERWKQEIEPEGDPWRVRFQEIWLETAQEMLAAGRLVRELGEAGPAPCADLKLDVAHPVDQRQC